MLAVGSGLAFAEEWLAKNGYVEHIVAFESSSVAVDSARERIATLGLQDHIEMRCGDVLSAGLQKSEFDAVFVQAAIHHFYNIEEMFAFFHYVLKPDGLILYDEYIGPDHHMYEPEVMDLMDEVNECLAPSYRWDVLRQTTRDEVPRATLEYMLDMDPSEGVHSTQILPLTYKYFDVNWKNGVGILGGAILFLPASKRAKKNFLVGKSVKFLDNDERTIIQIKENDGSLIVTFSGEKLSPDVAGYPNLFKVSENAI